MKAKLETLIAALAVMAGAPLGAQAPTSEPPRAEAVLSTLGFDAGDVRRMTDGEIVASDLEEQTKKELATVMAMVVRLPFEEVASWIRAGRALEYLYDVEAYGFIEDREPHLSDLAEVGYEAGESREVEKLLRVAPGSEFNLSTEEIGRFESIGRGLKPSRASKDPAVREAINDAYRAVLLRRLIEYRAGGIDRISPYARSRTKVASPAEELRTAVRAAGFLREQAPACYETFSAYPETSPDGRPHESRFVWMKKTIESRPAFVLGHRLLRVEEDSAVLGFREIYVGHTYNSQEILLGCMRVRDGTVVFYTNRTSTDKVAGFGSDLAHAIGRDRMRRRIRSEFQAMRDAIESGKLAWDR